MGADSQALGAQLPVEEFLGSRHIRFVEMLDDNRNVRVLLGKPLQVIIVIEAAKARRRKLDLADAAERMRFGRSLEELYKSTNLIIEEGDA